MPLERHGVLHAPRPFIRDWIGLDILLVEQGGQVEGQNGATGGGKIRIRKGHPVAAVDQAEDGGLQGVEELAREGVGGLEGVL